MDLNTSSITAQRYFNFYKNDQFCGGPVNVFCGSLVWPPAPLDACALQSSMALADLRWEEGAPGWRLGSNNVSLIKQE